jgi:hypothetical protein
VDEGESEKGAWHQEAAFIGVMSGKGRRGGPGWRLCGIERRAERGGPGAVVGGWHRPVADGRGWVARLRVGEAGSLTRGHSNG